jgi:hypothetical protein
MFLLAVIPCGHVVPLVIHCLPATNTSHCIPLSSGHSDLRNIEVLRLSTAFCNSLSHLGIFFLISFFKRFILALFCSTFVFHSCIALFIVCRLFFQLSDILVNAFIMAFLLTVDSHALPKNHHIAHNTAASRHAVAHNIPQPIAVLNHLGIVVYAFASSGIDEIISILCDIHGTNCSNLDNSCAFAGLLILSNILSILSFICHFFLASL